MKGINFLLTAISIFLTINSVDGQHNHGNCATADLQKNANGFVLLCAGGNRHDRTLTYSFENQSTQLGTVSQQAVRNAFTTWHNVTGIGFREVNLNQNPDVRIRWVNANQSVEKALVGSALAVAWRRDCNSSKYGHLIEFDDSEVIWSTNFALSTFDLETVAVHEIGHIIGFNHSPSQNSVMYASLSKGHNGRDLDEIDISGAKFLYPGDFFSTADNIRGWSWENQNKTASYIAYNPSAKKSMLYIRTYDGNKSYDTDIKYHTFSSGDNIRGWSWDVNNGVASYLAYDKSKKQTTLYIRDFDGVKFGAVRRAKFFSSGDNIRGWSWDIDNNYCTYIALKNGKSILYKRGFDGNNFQSPSQQFFSSRDNIRAWSWDKNQGRCGYFEYRKAGRNSILYRRTFNGSSFGEVEE